LNGELGKSDCAGTGRPSTIYTELQQSPTKGAVQPLNDYTESSLAWRKSIVAVLGVFGILALALAAVGIYEVMSYIAAQRSREIGIRIAMGAQPRDVLAIVISQGLRLVGIGIATGVVAGVALTHLMSSLLFGVSPTGPADICRGGPSANVRCAGCLLHSCAASDARRSHRRLAIRIGLANHWSFQVVDDPHFGV
jgi:ABC-type antimicrobial peptide transport system permease subunit